MSVSEKARALVAEYVAALLDDATTRTANLTSPRFLREQKARRELDDYVAALEAVADAARDIAEWKKNDGAFKPLRDALADLDASGGTEGK